jgi:hypothetical protein
LASDTLVHENGQDFGTYSGICLQSIQTKEAQQQQPE